MQSWEKEEFNALALIWKDFDKLYERSKERFHRGMVPGRIFKLNKVWVVYRLGKLWEFKGKRSARDFVEWCEARQRIREKNEKHLRELQIKRNQRVKEKRHREKREKELKEKFSKWLTEARLADLQRRQNESL